MIVVKLQGGLGNQMFQYAAGLRLARKRNTALRLDIRSLLDRNPRLGHVFREFDLPVFPDCRLDVVSAQEMAGCLISKSPLLCKVSSLAGRTALRIVRETNHPALLPGILDAPDNVYLDGYWQSEFYFADICEEVRRCFRLDAPEEIMVRELGKIIAEECSVCVNVRRGDFVSHPDSIKTHGFCGIDYYRHAVDYLREIQGKFSIFVFSDDIDWCRDNLRFDAPTVYVDHTYAGYKFSSYLWLMTQCRHFVIANSTFSWWAAWLSTTEKIVVAPKKWFAAGQYDSSSIVPPAWVVI